MGIVFQSVGESFHNTKERIRKLFDKAELSASSYDTAWVAMVPSPHYSQTPSFPECLDWLLENQLHDGSWGRPHHNPLLLKDTLSSTLASILALKRWMVGEEQINKGLRFIELNFSSATDNSLHSPIGFDIIFPGMLEYAQDLDLKINVEPTAVNAMTDKRKLELIRCKERKPQERDPYLAYISEGIGKSQDWEMVMKYQRKNGSLFNSPSTTAAAFSHLQNAGCLNYLRSAVQKFGRAVPTVYPFDIYMRLSLIDNLESLGIDRHFRKEINSVLDETYSCWLNGEQEIFMDATTCALAFRILRVHGYDVSSDPLTEITKQQCYLDSLHGDLNATSDVLELYKASQIIIHPDEFALEKLHSWSESFLKQKWILENNIDKLKFARKTGPYCYFSIAATLFAPELFDARMTWAKASMLTTVVDDFFDDEGSMEELLNLIQLVERWDVNVETDCLSEEIRIIFLALRRFICDIEDRAFLWQARSVKSHWLNLMRSMLKEAEWARSATVPTMEEYIANAYVSFALEPIVPPTLYFLGPKLSHDVVQSSELNTLFKLMSTCGRLLNDSVTFKRESGQGKLNSVLLHVIHSNGAISEEEAIKEIRGVLDSHRRELLRLVLQETGSVVPRVCKELFWMMNKVNHFFYDKEDKFTFYDTRKTVKEIIHVPIFPRKFNSSS
ncbi:hypothetical protein RJ639_016243 [Escallonia herrerae]|uniref:Ent-kaurene synthase n=1 Tax=Escallonia herrerae TaxID=1293975 RepID=A0AA88VGB3_9ASTE|nr:hypothetical protein RJ639_016243 [Escallonia herrerae]